MIVIACIPAFNEEKVIGNIVRRTVQHVSQVVVCDDGSSDKTSKESETAGATVIRHDKNLGKGATLKTFFKYSKNSGADIMVTMDGDGQFLPEEIPKLVKPIIENMADVVIGYRFDDTTDMPSYRKIGNKFLDTVTNLASELPFRDTQSGFRAYSRKAIETIGFSSDGFGADSEILVDAAKKGLRISEEKVTVLYNTGASTSTKNPVSHTGEVLTSLIELVALKRPLKFLGIPGIILILAGIGFGIYVLSTFNETRYFSIPFTLVALGSLIAGLLLLLMSVVLFGISRTNRQNNL
ncbi:MAG: glycosyltransferase family 2 protein [Patescibacteria group bacterium]|nr:glycosyltransferase family 2 protein [Patescibacteria group bacterium]